MAQYDNTNTGMLKRNDRKETENQADYKGVVNVEGVEYWLSAWIRVGKEGGKLAGQKYFSLSLQPIEQQSRPAARGAARGTPPDRDVGRGRAAPAGRGGNGFDDMDDDIPF